MTHYSRLDKFVIDVADGAHDQELAFWQGATGRTMTQHEPHPEYHWAPPDSTGLAFLVQRLDDGEPRVHLDIHTTDLEAEVTRLEQLGATRVRHVNDWWVMQDPAGLPFCVIPARSGTLNDDNAQRWEQEGRR